MGEQVLPVSLETVSKLAGVDAITFGQLFEEKDGAKVAISNQELINKTLMDAVNNRITSVASEREEIAKRAGRLEVYTQVESEAKKLGIETKWTEDGLKKIASHFQQSKQTTPSEYDITKDEKYITAIQSYEKKLQKLRDEYDAKIDGITQEHIVDEMKRYSLNMVQDKALNLTNYPDEVTANLNDIAVMRTVEKAKAQGLRVVKERENGKVLFKLVDSEGKPYRDPQQGYTEVDFRSFHLDNLKNGLFPEQKAQPITSGSPGMSKEVFVSGSGDKKKEYHLPPTLKSMSQEEYASWTNKMLSENAPSELINHANKEYFNK